MVEPRELIDDTAMQRVSRLRLVARTVVQSFVSGQHRSVYKGFSVEFAQHRQYTQGDELRHIDWKVFGKTDRLFVKQYEEETNLRAMLCLDASGSMLYRGGGERKFDYARKLAAALAYLMVGQADAVGLVTFDTAVRAQIPARATSGHLNTLLRTLAETEPQGETNLAPILHNLSGQLKRRGLVLILSDFFAPVEDLVRVLGHFHHKRHEVILFHILDPHELTFPFETVAEFRSLESTGDRLRLDAPRVRRLYLERLEGFMQRLREACHRFHYDHVLLDTSAPCDMALSRYLMRRRER
ncbi:MAG: DUF58 domain-containing protein [Planctomycetota bacterium]|nr:DUF58 domain-containing protein [Planctomycetota bacterium]